MAAAHVTYHAISIFSSHTFWLNAITVLVEALSITEVIVIIPARFVPLSAAVVAVANIWLRTRTVRPVALIKPGRTKAVPVPKLGPPDPPALTD